MFSGDEPNNSSRLTKVKLASDNGTRQNKCNPRDRRRAGERRITARSPPAHIPPVSQRGLTKSSTCCIPVVRAVACYSRTSTILHSSSPSSTASSCLRSQAGTPPRSTSAHRTSKKERSGRGGEEIHGEQRGGRCRGRGVAQGHRAEGHGGSSGPACQGGGQPDAPEVPAGSRPCRRQGLGDAPQVHGVEAGGRAGRRHAAGACADGAVARDGLPGRRRPLRPPRPARLPGQALLRQPGHGRLQTLYCLLARQHLRQDPQRPAGEVSVHRGPQGVGVRQLRRARLHRGHRDHAELLPGAAGQGAHDPRALPVHEGVEDGAALHRRQHQGQVRVCGRQELGGDAAAGDGRRPAPGDVRREVGHCSPRVDRVRRSTEEESMYLKQINHVPCGCNQGMALLHAMSM